jgi:hypothetical protein
MLPSQSKILKKKPMKNAVVIFILIPLTTICFTDCNTHKKVQNPSVSMALPPTIVYKTKKNYDKNVAVYLSEDKKHITGYPDPVDVSQRSYPTPLKDGYLLDNRGIGKNTAFISMTYEEYAALKKVLSVAELYNMIIDDDPILEMYNCGNHAKYKNIIDDLNQLIDKKFKGCQKIK